MNLLQLKASVASDLTAIQTITTDQLMHTNNAVLLDIYRHVLLQPGKQIRALLMVLVYKLYHPKCSTDLHTFASGIEIIHLASLVHDDIIDCADTRRNQSSVQHKFGMNNAVISGVHLYALALQLFVSTKSLDGIHHIAQTVQALCEGESDQLNNRFNFKQSLDNYWQVVELKTASLFKSSCVISAMLAGESTHTLFSKLGSVIGDLFQLTDDYLDIYGHEHALSKKLNQDIDSGDASLPILIAGHALQSSNPSVIRNYLLRNKTCIQKELKEIIQSKHEDATHILNAISNQLNVPVNSIRYVIESIVNRAI